MKTAKLIQQFVISSVVLAVCLTGVFVLLSLGKIEVDLQALTAHPIQYWLQTEQLMKLNTMMQQFQHALSRPLWPDVSLFLPLEVQLLISLGLFFSILLVGVFFPKNRGLLIVLTVVSVLRHLVWRGVDTLVFPDTPHTIIGYTLYAAEILAFISLSLGYFQLYKPTDRAKFPAKLNEAKNAQVPHVDILVCTYNESLSVLYRTLVGCVAMDYPKKTIYLLDDGKRDAMAQLAQHLGVEYIARAENLHAKAGNLNNALTLIKGDLVMVLDADHVPSRNTLRELTGYFQTNAQLAFIQTPQHFFSLDPFQRNLVLEDVIQNEQDFFFQVIQPGNDYWHATFFAGTGALFRRAALTSVNGFATETITEDTHTGLRLHAKGWKSIMYNKNLIAGMAQDSFQDLVKQRVRWSRGMAQIFYYDHPLWTKGLSWGQRICYFSGIWYFYMGFTKLLFILAPLAYLLGGFMTINAGILEIGIYYLPSFVALYWGYSVLTGNVRHLFWGEIYETALCVYTSLSAFSTLIDHKKSKFLVTPKGALSDDFAFHWQFVLPQIILGLATSVGLVLAAYRAYVNPIYLGGLFTNFMWGVYNLALLMAAIYVAQERPQHRLAPRVTRTLPCELRLLDGTIAVGKVTNISESGLAAEFEEPIPVAGTMNLRLRDFETKEVTVLGVQVVRSYVDPQSKRHSVGLRLVNRTDAVHQALVRHMFCSSEPWDTSHYFRCDWGVSLLNMLNTAFRLNKVEEVAYRRRTPRFQVFLPCFLSSDTFSQVEATTNEVSETGLSLVVSDCIALVPESGLKVTIQWSNGHVSTLDTRIKRVQPFEKGQVSVGVNFLKLSKEERLEVIEQIYGSREGLIRVAPSVAKLLPCTLRFEDGTFHTGATQELSEMGVRVHLDRPLTVQTITPVTVELSWVSGERSIHEGMLLPRKLTRETQGIHLIYFKNTSLQELENLSKRLHLPETLPRLG
ncbi:MAG: glycosyltransferase [Candidatus Melainabacteria bacterium]|nr:glycosyltransferase [Candidatus Melainabacteria bacterium]